MSDHVECAIVPHKRCSKPFCVWMYYARKAEEAKIVWMQSIQAEVKKHGGPS